MIAARGLGGEESEMGVGLVVTAHSDAVAPISSAYPKIHVRTEPTQAVCIAFPANLKAALSEISERFRCEHPKALAAQDVAGKPCAKSASVGDMQRPRCPEYMRVEEHVNVQSEPSLQFRRGRTKGF